MAVNPAGAGMSVAERFGGAAGLVHVRPGFCFSADFDALFALGWPHVRFVVDGHRDDESPHAAALRILTAGGDPPARLRWPRGVAQGLVRAWALPALFELGPGSRGVRGVVEEALWNTSPVTPDEAARLLSARMVQDVAGLGERAMENFVLLLEALTGVEPVGGAIVDALEQMEPDLLLAEWTLPPMITWSLGFLLARAPSGVARAWEDRLRRVLDRVYAARPALRRHGFRGAGSSHARALHLVMGGGAAAESSSDRALRWYAHVTDDPVLVRMRVAVNRLGYEPDARLVFLGGNDVIARYARDWSSQRTLEQQRWFLEQMAPIRAQEMYPLMLDLAGRSLVRAEATAWFVAHAADAVPFLAGAAAGDGLPGAHARQVLKAIAAR